MITLPRIAATAVLAVTCYVLTGWVALGMALARAEDERTAGGPRHAAQPGRGAMRHCGLGDGRTAS